MKKPFFAICYFLIMVGVAGFFAPLFNMYVNVPPSFEWPVGFADNIISTRSGLHIVPHIPSGRIQIYDANWTFIRGWNIDASGGYFKVLPFDEDRQQIEVITRRKSHKYSIDIDGNLLSQEPYSAASYNAVPEKGEARWIATPFWLWPFIHPFASWGTAALGMLGLTLLRKKKSAQLS